MSHETWTGYHDILDHNWLTCEALLAVLYGWLLAGLSASLLLDAVCLLSKVGDMYTRCSNRSTGPRGPRNILRPNTQAWGSGS